MNICEMPPLEGGFIFDTHAHYDDKAFDSDRDEVIEQLHNYGVCGIINCACESKSVKTTLELAHKYDFIYAAVGLHPEEDEPYNEELIAAAASDKKCVAIGEIGLDYHWDSVPREVQADNFEKQIILADSIGKPVIIHDREAHADTFDLINKHRPRGVVHCFSGSAEMAKQIVSLGMYIGIGGVVTFKNARKTVEIAEQIPLERILLETDCPYMAPVPFRGERCNSAMIYYDAMKIAEIKKVPLKTVLSVTRENAERLFGI